jgi:hypothetical protein
MGRDSRLKQNQDRRVCIFCDRTDLNREHVWPDWISRFLFAERKKGRLTATAMLGRVPVHSWPTPDLNHKAKIVCPGCNHGWMGDVENACQALLNPMIVGHETVEHFMDRWNGGLPSRRPR